MYKPFTYYTSPSSHEKFEIWGTGYMHDFTQQAPRLAYVGASRERNSFVVNKLMAVTHLSFKSRNNNEVNF